MDILQGFIEDIETKGVIPSSIYFFYCTMSAVVLLPHAIKINATEGKRFIEADRKQLFEVL